MHAACLKLEIAAVEFIAVAERSHLYNQTQNYHTAILILTGIIVKSIRTTASYIFPMVSLLVYSSLCCCCCCQGGFCSVATLELEPQCVFEKGSPLYPVTHLKYIALLFVCPQSRTIDLPTNKLFANQTHIQLESGNVIQKRATYCNRAFGSNRFLLSGKQYERD